MDTERAWAAGFFDGEGCVRIAIASRRNSSLPRATLSITIGNTDRRGLDRFRHAFPTVKFKQYTHGGTPLSRMTVYYLNTWSAGACAVLEEMLPHLTIKREQADLAIQFFKLPWHGRGARTYGGMGKGDPRTPQQVTVELDMARQMKSMKRQQGAM